MTPTDFEIVQLQEEVVTQCPHCDAIHGRGEMVLQVDIDGELYVYAELMVCCQGDHPEPVIVLFDSHEPAQEALNRFVYNLRRGLNPFNCPLVKKSLAFGP